MSETLTTRTDNADATFSPSFQAEGMPRAAALAKTKFMPPPLRPGLVARPQLVARLNEAPPAGLSLIAAPAGSGKTTLLAEWAAEGNRAVAWLALEEGDNDPARFWQALAAAVALRTGAPAVAAQDENWLPSLVETRDVPALAPVLLPAIALINRLAALPEPLVLALDDYQVIETSAIQQGMAYLIEHLPAQARVLIAARVDPPLPLARLRARGLLTELHAADLRFTQAETAAFLAQHLDQPLSPAQVAQLETQTEGWVAGVQLAALALRGQDDMSSALASFSGAHRYPADYLMTEVFSRQPPSVQEFLLATAPLDRLSAALCEVVTGQPGGQECLEGLERANLFLVPLDEERRWYRYHALFAGMLRERLARTQPERMPELHRRAARLYAENGQIGAAIEHALAARDYVLAARWLLNEAQTLIVRGELATLAKWIEALPEDLIRATPALCLYYAVVLTNLGRLDAAEARLDDAERALRSGEPDPLGQDNEHDEHRAGRMRTQLFSGTLGDIVAGRAVVAGYRGDIARSVALTQEALTLLPSDSGFVRSVTTAGVGAAYWWAGEVRAAEAAFAEARAVGERTGILHVIMASLGGEGIAQLVGGRLHQAAATLRLGLLRGARMEGGPIPASCIVYSGLAAILCEWNQLDAAEAHLRLAHELGRLWNDIGILVYIHFNSVRCAYARGDRAAVLALLDEAERLVQWNELAQMESVTAAWRARFLLWLGDLAAAAVWQETCGLPLAVEAPIGYNREVEYLTLVRVLIARRRADEALNLIAQLQHAAALAGRIGSLRELRLLQALAEQAVGKDERACATLANLLAETAPEGYLRLFADEGQPMALLLRLLAASPYPARAGVPPDYLAQVQATLNISPADACGDERADARDGSGLLSERERVILRLVATGLSNNAIADELVVAASTVKWHMKQVYLKLGVHSRTQALARARELGLLP